MVGVALILGHDVTGKKVHQLAAGGAQLLFNPQKIFNWDVWIAAIAASGQI
jgi:hypothetical protein